MRVSTYNRIENLYKEQKGYIGTIELLKNGFSNRQIAMLTDEGYLEKVCHGYYWMVDNCTEKPMDYKCIEACLSNSRAVICMDSACYYLGVTKTEPEHLSVATERTDRSMMRMNFPIERHYFSDSKFTAGINRVQTEFGSYNIYSVERSVCDMFRLGKTIEIEVINHMKKEQERYRRLLKYAELLGVNKYITREMTSASMK